jgi:hypothetical protein
MPIEVISRPNPQPLPSHIPDVVEELKVELKNMTLDKPACDALLKFRRAALYIAAGKRLPYSCVVSVVLSCSLPSNDIFTREYILEATINI